MAVYPQPRIAVYGTYDIVSRMSDKIREANKKYWASIPPEERSRRMRKLKKDYWKTQDPKARRKFALKLVRARKKKIPDENNKG